MRLGYFSLAVALCVAVPAHAEVGVLVENGVVTNRAVFNGPVPDEWKARGWVLEDQAQIGWTREGDRFVAPPPPPTRSPVELPKSEVEVLRDALIKEGVLTREKIDRERSRR